MLGIKVKWHQSVVLFIMLPHQELSWRLSETQSMPLSTLPLLLEVPFYSNLACALFSRTWIDVSGQGPK